MEWKLPKITKAIINEDAYMKFYSETRPLYLDTDEFGVGLEVGLLQIREEVNCPQDEPPHNSTLIPTAFASKTLSTMGKEVIGIILVLEKFYQYCFAREVSIIIDHKQPVTTFKNHIVTLPTHLVRIHQYRIRILYKLRTDLFMTD